MCSPRGTCISVSRAGTWTDWVCYQLSVLGEDTNRPWHWFPGNSHVSPEEAEEEALTLGPRACLCA